MSCHAKPEVPKLTREGHAGQSSGFDQTPPKSEERMATTSQGQNESGRTAQLLSAGAEAGCNCSGPSASRECLPRDGVARQR
jgi:hypothetical protein